MKNNFININLLLIFVAFNVTFNFNYDFNSLYIQIPTAVAENNSKAEADRLRQQGEKQIEAGQYVQGTNLLEQAMMIYRQIGDKESAKNIVNRIFVIYGSQGAHDKLERLLPIYQELNYNENQVNSEEQTKIELDNRIKDSIDLGFVQLEKQNYVLAKSHFEEALSQAKSLGGEKEKIEAFKAIGIFYLYTGDYTNTLANLKLAKDLLPARIQAIEKEIAIMASGGGINQMSQKLSAIASDTVPILLLLGETYLQQKNPSEALTYFEKAAAIEAKVDNDYHKSFLHFFYVDPYLFLSRANYSLGKYDVALTYARKAIEKGQSIQDPFVRDAVLPFSMGDFGNGHGHVLAGIALEKLGKLEQAEQELKQAVKIFETIRKKSSLQKNIKENLKLFDNQVRATSLLQRILLAQNKSAEALAATESGRGRLLVEAATASRQLTLEEKIDAIINARHTPESLCKEEEKLDRLYPGTRSGFECDGKKLMQELKEKYLEEVRESPEMIDMFTSATPSNINPLNVGQLQQIVQSHQVTLVQYSIISETTFFHSSHTTQKGSWRIFPAEEQKLAIWVVKPTGKIYSRLIDLKAQNVNLKDLVANTRRTMGLDRTIGVTLKPGAKLPDGSTRNSSGVQSKEKLKQLHKLLIDPIADLLPNNPEAKVVFVPDKQLFLVPFAALIDSKDKYFIEKHTSTTAPSIQALEVTRQKKQQQTKPGKLAVVVGNPTRNLPGAEQEGREVARLLNSQFLTGNQATKALLLQRLPSARYIHLATHGLLEDYTGFGIPGAVALAPSQQDNGLLTSSEIQELDLKAELAVLSACDTGGGDITGDGVVGLSRALIIAGVPSIVVSLWSVPDAPTAELMVEFYRNFQERNLDKAQALRQAMLKMMQTHPDPINWAGFTLIGQSK